MEQLFFDLIRVSIGTQSTLSRQPSAREWGKLYKSAEKQSLLGVCFVGLQNLGADADDGFERIGIPEEVYFQWVGMAAQIQQRNEEVNHQCVELQERLAEEGFRSCVLKGQGVAQLYGEQLAMLRQSGDIDVQMWKDGLNEKKNRNAVVAYAHAIDAKAKASEHHIAVRIFDETEVEMHYAPAYLCNPFADKRFKKWCVEHRDAVDSGRGFSVPTIEYDVVFMLAHTFRHYMSEGVGMRQMMDYYFVLRKLDKNLDKDALRNDLKSFGMLKFAGAVMWVMQYVFGLDGEDLICEPNEKLGRKLLAHIMEGGNFGHHNKKTFANKNTHSGRFLNQVAHDMKLACDYPGEALWSPLSMIREFIRIRL